MKFQCKNQKRHVLPFPHSSASASAPSDVRVASVEPENSQTVSTRRITFKFHPNPLDRAELPKRTRAEDDGDSAHLSVYYHET